jgi:predicted CXXCH cytochrome family protein
VKHKFFIALSIVVLGLLIGIIILHFMPSQVTKTSVAGVVKEQQQKSLIYREYVGANACEGCHQAEFKAWQGSHHELAMQEANIKTVLGDFNNATFKYNNVESTFFRRDDSFMVRTDGPDGKLTEYPIAYTFGISPLQQYLIAFPGGRYQVLSIAWDSRPQTEGGQHWFHLYPKEKIAHTDQLHWTGRYQNWNMECADCHSTHVKKGYDSITDSYKTTFKEVNVACESCHGPASRHIKWAQHDDQSSYSDVTKGLGVVLKSDRQETWAFSDNSGIAHRKQPASDALMNTCWTCHSRRSTLVEGSLPGLSLEDSHHPALLTQPNYYADGQQRDEDYTWGSFRQSKMFQQGVTCMDCHEPHSLKLRAEGNALCIRCHKAEKFDTQKHHFHKEQSKGADCMDCHAPEQNYMGNDGRHDHSFRLPRPDLSELLGSPNACIQCHTKQNNKWAASSLDKWLGKSWRQRPHYGTTLQAGESEGIKALPELIELAQNQSSSALVRATAVNLLKPLMSPDLLLFAREQLKDKDPSVRIAGLGLIESIDPINRVLMASPLLIDSVRGVRIEAARILTDLPDDQITSNHIESRRSAMKEYLNYLDLNADWPVENVNLGNLYSRQHNFELAIAAFERALKLDPRFVRAYVNLADVYRQLHRDNEGEQQLRNGLSLSPMSADLHHALGLLLVRRGDKNSALKELAEAANLSPENIRYAYIYAIGLHSTGKLSEALAVLKPIAEKTNDIDILSALISMNREVDNNKAALVYAIKLAEILPNNMEIKQLIRELRN